MSDLANKIRSIRFSLGETMEEFGARFNTSKATINNWEKGRNKPNKNNLLIIANLGGLSVEELIMSNKQIYFKKRLKERILHYINHPIDEFRDEFGTFLEQYQDEIFSRILNEASKISIDDLSYIDIEDFIDDEINDIILFTPKSTSQSLENISRRISQIASEYKKALDDSSKLNFEIDELDKNSIRIVISKLEQLANEVDKMALDEFKKNK